jgi:glutaredoxin
MASVSGNQPAAQPRPLVELLTTSDCPHCDAALALVQRVCWQLDGQAEVRVILVADQPAAERLRFLGSPTIRVNGRDIEPGAEWNDEYVHGCRLYQGEHSLRGLPQEAWLRQALQDAHAQS